MILQAVFFLASAEVVLQRLYTAEERNPKLSLSRKEGRNSLRQIIRSTTNSGHESSENCESSEMSIS
jgi:hypothetical protein